MHPLMPRIRVITFLVFVGLSSVRCNKTAAETEPQVPICPKQLGSEFSVRACAVIAGTVRDANGRGLSGVYIRVFTGNNRDYMQDAFEVTEPTGSFRNTVALYDDPRNDTGELLPLPLSMLVRVEAAAYKGYPQPTPTTFYTDSTLATLVFVAAGQPSQTTNVTLTVRLP
jgi:hypothetical protein